MNYPDDYIDKVIYGDSREVWCDIAEKRIEYMKQEVEKEDSKQLDIFQEAAGD